MFKQTYCLPCHLVCNTTPTSTKAIIILPSWPFLLVNAMQLRFSFKFSSQTH